MSFLFWLTMLIFEFLVLQRPVWEWLREWK
jgi:hypothetical protein